MQSKRGEKRGSETAKRWANDQAERVGEEVRRLRMERNLSAVQLAARTEHVGYPITRATIAKIESNTRSAKLDVAELIALAAALEVAPLELLYPGLISKPVEIWPGRHGDSLEAALQFSGEQVMGFDFTGIHNDPSATDEDADGWPNVARSSERLGLARQWNDLIHVLMEYEDRLEDYAEDEPMEGLAHLAAGVSNTQRLIAFIADRMLSLGMQVDPAIRPQSKADEEEQS